jgi:SHS2 domain-containing protein
MGRFEIIDHTADIAFRIFGDNPSDFYIQAFNGFREVCEINRAKTSENETEATMEINGIDPEEILVKFLNNLIAYIQENSLSPCGISISYLDNETMKYTLKLRKILEFPDGYVEMKAATYHMLKIDSSGDQLSASCIIDI